MSQENVELVKTAVEAFNRRDVRALARISTADLEIVSALTAANLGADTYRGTEAWTDYFAAMDETWTTWRVEDPDLYAAGDRVACLCRLVGEGKRSGVPVERPVGITYHVREARLWRICSYLDPVDALAAVGLTN
jgi:ketosteroid isomerase-like protein